MYASSIPVALLLYFSVGIIYSEIVSIDFANAREIKESLGYFFLVLRNIV